MRSVIFEIINYETQVKTVKGLKEHYYILSPLKGLLRPKDVGDLQCATTPYIRFAGKNVRVTVSFAVYIIIIIIIIKRMFIYSAYHINSTYNYYDPSHLPPSGEDCRRFWSTYSTAYSVSLSRSG